MVGATGSTRTSTHGTRERILVASIDELVERGIRHFTTTAVAHRAHLAQGTLFRYFPTKDDLLAATAEAAIAATIEETIPILLSRLSENSSGDDRATIGIIIEVLWDAYSSDRVLAAYEVRASCRTDARLADALGLTMQTMDSGSADVFAMLVPETFRLSSDDIAAATRVVTAALQGRAATRVSFPDPTVDRLLLEALVDYVMSLASYHEPTPPSPLSNTTRNNP